MKEESKKDLLKVIGATVFTVALASSAFLIVNKAAFAAATQPALLDYALTQTDKEDFNEQGYKEPSLNIIWDKNLDADGNPYPYNIPTPDAMPYEEAAKIGVKYIWEMTGDGLDGKSVEMLYAAWPSSSREYWIGTVADSPEDFIILGKNRHRFLIDAVTGERVGIDPGFEVPYLSELEQGEGRTVIMTPAELEAMQHQEPADSGDSKEIAWNFAMKHFNHSNVENIEFALVTVPADRSKYREIYDEGKDVSYPFTLYDRGRQIYFDVTDDTGRTATVMVDMDSGQVMSLDTSNSDFVPGYNAEDNPDAVG